MSMRPQGFNRTTMGALLLASALLGACSGDQGIAPAGTTDDLISARSVGGVTPVVIAGNPSCSTLNGLNDQFPTITSNFGFKVESDYNRTVPMDGSAAGTSLTGGAPADPINTVTLASTDGVYLDWSSTLGMDAVIMKGGPDGNSFVYAPESFGDQGLVPPTNASNGQPYGISHVEFCYDYELTAEKTAEAEYTRTYEWDISKTVDIREHSGIAGQQFTSSYDVTVTPTITDSGFKVSGEITVTNSTPFEVEFSIEDLVGGTAAAVTCSEGTTLAAGAETTCTYAAELGDDLPENGTNVATITSLNGNVGGAAPQAPYTFGDPTTINGYPEVHVTDYFDGDAVGKALGSASGGFTFEYDQTFACPTDGSMYTEGAYSRSFPNYAKIDETGQSTAPPEAANVDLVCSNEDLPARIDLLKLTNGVETLSQTWSFAIYEGPDGFGGTAVASDGTPPALLDFGMTDLDPSATYTLCELEVPAGYSTSWWIDTDGDGDGDNAVAPYNPNADDVPSEDLGNRCVDFGAGTDIPLESGATLHLVVNNQAPYGDPRTPGYWKNWNMCSAGHQQATAEKNGGHAAGFWLLEDVLNPNIGGGITWDDILADDYVFPIEGCALAVDLLDKREIGDPAVVGDGAKAASDPLVNLATHLLAAQLNFGANACTTQEVLDAAADAEALLDKYDFDGTAGLLPASETADIELAHALADYLDRYNNGEFCGNGNG